MLFVPPGFAAATNAKITLRSASPGQILDIQCHISHKPEYFSQPLEQFKALKVKLLAVYR